ncbi:MAG: efflux RND transporter permease subunit [Thiotrichales bacterium]
MHGMIAWFTRNSVAANLLMFTIIGMGLYATFFRIPLEIFPDISREVITVETTYRGATPAEVERSISIRIEEAVADLNGVDNIYSDASEGISRVRIELLNGFTTEQLLPDVKNRVDTVKAQFPEEVEEPIVAAIQRKREVISVVVSGEMSERDLRRLAENVRDDLANLPQVTQVQLTGVRRYELAVEVPEAILQAYGLSLGDVSAAISRFSRDIPAGSIKTRGGEVLLRSMGQAYNAADFARIPVLGRADGTRVTLGEIATIRDGFEEEPLYARFDGKPAVELDVYRVGEQNAIEVAAAVRDYLDVKRVTLPDTVELSYWRDRSQYINARLSTLLKSAWQGGILIFLLLTLFLRLSVALWVCVGIPISFFGALALMPEIGATFNLISLFAFILVLGIVVDDAIVTGENIYSHLKRGDHAEDAAITGAQEIAIPVTFGVLTTVVAFVPLLMIGGARGDMFAQIPMIVIPVLLFSLIESKFILPAHLKHVRIDRNQRLNPLQRFQRGVADGLERFVERVYQPFLEMCLRRRYLTLAAVIAFSLIILSIVLSGRWGYTFFPRIQSETARATLTMPRGTPIEVTEQYVFRIEEKARELQHKYIDPATGKSVIEHIMTNVGQSSGGAKAGQGQSHLGRISFEITPPEKRHVPVTSKELVREWRKSIGQIPGAKSLAFRAEIGRSGSPVSVQLEGNDFARLRSAANEVKAHLQGVPGVFGIEDSFEGGKEEIKLRLKPGAEGLGLTLTDLGQQVRNAFFGAQAQRIQRGRDDLRVMVKLPVSERHAMADVYGLRIKTPSGNFVTLEEVAEIEVGQGFSTINRVNRKRTVTIDADIDKEATNINKVTQSLNEFLPELLTQYPGMRYSFQGEQREQKESMSSLRYGMLGVLFMIYALLAIPFRSYVQPFIVMAIIPFSIIGAILGHMIMGKSLSIMSLMGMLALAGVVVNDSLVLVDYINKKRKSGHDLVAAVRAAGAARFRPILLTSLTTFFGLTPLILEKSTQAQFLIPMAISLGFGIMFATLITLIVVPASYLMLEDAKGFFRRIWKSLPDLLKGSKEATDT